VSTIDPAVLTQISQLYSQLIAKANVSHTHTSVGVSDASTIGRQLITAVDAPTARAAINAAGTSVNTINAPGATPAINANLYSQVNLTGINAAITSLSSGLTGNWVDGQQLRWRFKDNGIAQAITLGGLFRAIGVTLPTTTVATKTTYMLTVYNLADAIWDVIDVKTQP
jgi:hypothetical protein